ncbi:MAG: hypothetical protein H7A53_06125 [Akkermansiaceae bacterium]|nr:hypothetical protein [Akkermansiaceae bacterium]
MIENLIENASSYGGKVDWLFTLITILVGFWFVAEGGALFHLQILMEPAESRASASREIKQESV